MEHFAVVQIIIQKFCLFNVALLHCSQAAVFFQPFKHQFADVNGVAGGRVIKRIVVRLDLIVEHGRRDVTCFAEQVLADNANGKTCGRHILLCAAVNHTEFCNIQRLRQEAGGNIRNQRHVAGVGQFVIYRAVNGVVHADIEIIRVRRKGGFVKFRNIRESLVCGRSDNVHFAVFLRFGAGFFCPLAGDDIICFAAAVHKVQRNCGKLGGSAAL